MHMNMMSVNLTLSRADAAYVSGEKLKGQVRVNVNGRPKIRAVYVAIRGKGRIVVGHEVMQKTFVDDFMELWKPAGDITVQNDLLLPFEYQLDPSLPSSTRFKHAMICYHIEVIVNRVWETDWRYKREFTIMKPADLSKLSGTKLPINKQLVDSGSNKRPIEISLHLPSQSLISRNKIPLTVKVGKNSPKGVTKTELKLRQICRAKVGNQEKTCARTVFSELSGKLGNGNEIEWNDNGLIVPAVASSGECWSYLQVFYEMQFIIYYGMNGPKLRFDCPVTVGTSMTLSTGQTFSSVTPKDDQDFGSAILLNTKAVPAPVGYRETDRERDIFFQKINATTGSHSEEDDDDDCQSLHGSSSPLAENRPEFPVTLQTGNVQSGTGTESPIPNPGRIVRETRVNAPSPAPRASSEARAGNYRGVSSYHEGQQQPPPYPPSYEECLNESSASQNVQGRQLLPPSTQNPSNNLDRDASINRSASSSNRNIQVYVNDRPATSSSLGPTTNGDRGTGLERLPSPRPLRRGKGFAAHLERCLRILPDDDEPPSLSPLPSANNTQPNISQMLNEAVLFD